MIGEDHNGRETPAFVAAMYAARRPPGYIYMAVEAGVPPPNGWKPG